LAVPPRRHLMAQPVHDPRPRQRQHLGHQFQNLSSRLNSFVIPPTFNSSPMLWKLTHVQQRTYRLNLLFTMKPTEESGWRSRYSDGLRAEQPGFDYRQCKIVLFSAASRPALGPTQSPAQRVPRASSPEVKRQGREADHSPPSRAEILNGGTN
jgi:hypothetical protein